MATTEKTVKKLTIHKMKKSAYNALPSKSADEMYFLTDVGGQVSEISSASADYVGEIVQYVGETNDTYTNGFFYKCIETDGVYSWTQVNVQEGGSYNAGTGIDITNDVISITEPTLKNVSPDLVNGLAITKNVYHGQGNFTTVIGIQAHISAYVGQYSTVVGAAASSSADNGIAIGCRAKTSAKSAIQIGCEWGGIGYTNSDANTFKVGNDNGNFEMMSADGTIPAARHATPPTENGTYVLKATVVDGVVTTEWVLES